MATWRCCLFILKFPSFVVFSLLWLKSASFLLFILTYIQTFALTKRFRSGWSLEFDCLCVLLGLEGFNWISSRGAGADTA